MEDITPELVARIASRLFRETPHDAGTAGASSAAAEEAPWSEATASFVPDASQIMPANPITGAHVPSALVPSAHVPSAAIPSPYMPSVPGYSPSLTVPVATAVPTGPPLPPQDFATGLPMQAPTASPGHRVPASSPGGLKAFVQQVRTAQAWPATPKPPASLGDGQLAAAQQAAQGTIPTHGPRPFDVARIRHDFPIFQQRIHGKPLIWFDNAATTQKPQSVIDAISEFYATSNSNIHRGAHTLAARATDAFEAARRRVQQFLGATSTKEIVFVRGTTEGINLITQTYGRKFLQPGDEIVLSVLEHHANIVPWQMVAKERGAVLRVIPVNDQGEILLSDYERLLGPRTKVVAITHASNSLGTILPIAEMTAMAKRYGARVLIDGAQSVAHLPVNVQELGCDFFVFSGHKVFGPTGIGAVFIREELHDIVPPWHGGGNMIRNVTFEETTYSDAPAKFEAGTPNVADAVGLGAAIDYVQRLGLAQIGQYEHQLLEHATQQLSNIPGLRIVGQARQKVGVVSFVLPHRTTEEVGQLLDRQGIAVRAGHHCSQPSLRRFGLESTVRPSFSLYNTHAEIDSLAAAIRRIVQSSLEGEPH